MSTSIPVPARAWAGLIVGSATVVLVILDAGFVALSFADIERSFPESSRTTLGWVSSGYFISLSAFMLVAGWFGDRVGRRKVFFGGLFVFALGALLTAAANSAWMLIAARVVQGAGAAALTPVSLAMVLPAFPPQRRATAVGAWGVAGALSGVIAPTVGALLIEGISWRAPFLTFIPLAFVAWIVGRRVLPDEAGVDPDGAVDPVAIISATVAVAALALAVTRGDRWGWWSGPTIFAVVLSVGSWLLLLRRARTHAGAPFDPEMFRVRSYAAASAVSFLSQAAFFSFFFSVPLFLIEVWDWSTLEAGFAVAVNQIAAAVVGISAGRWADGHGHRGVVVAGGLVSALGYGWLALASGVDPEPLRVLFPAFVVGGVGSMMIGSTTSAAAFRDLDDERLGRAAGSYYVTRRLGSAAGAVIAVAVLGDRMGVDAVDRFRIIWGFSALAYLASAAVMQFGFDRPITSRPGERPPARSRPPHAGSP